MTKRKQTVVLVVWLLGLAEPLFAAGAIEPYEGTLTQPAIALRDLDHGLQSLSDYRGKVVMVNFWAGWCNPCIAEMPGMQRLADRLKDRPFEILAVNVSEPRNRVKGFLEHMGLDITVLMDRNAAVFKDWQVKVLPTSFLLDGNGRVRYEAIGPVEWDMEGPVKLIEDLMLEQK